MDKPVRVKSISTLSDDQDYVRALDYSKHLGALFTASDNGFIRMWDINQERLVSYLNEPIVWISYL